MRATVTGVRDAPVGAADPAFRSWFRRLGGRWRLERRASDGSRFDGMAAFERQGHDAFALEESGTMRLGGGVALPAGRCWIWRFTGAPMLEIRYPPADGGELYHRLHPLAQGTGWACAAVHRCGNDLYQGAYRFDGDRMEIRHRVSGPAKDYTLEAVYDRLAGEGGDHG